MTEDTSVHPEEVWEEGMGAGGCYTNGKEARFIFNGLRWLKSKRSNRDRYPGFKTEVSKKSIISKKQAVTRCKKTYTARSQGKNGSFNIWHIPDRAKVRGRNSFGLWMAILSQHIKKRLCWYAKYLQKKKPHVELFREVVKQKIRICMAGKLEALNPLKSYPNVGHHYRGVCCSGPHLIGGITQI